MNVCTEYLTLTKPGIVVSNTLVAAAAFVFASRLYAGFIDWSKFTLLLAGLACIVGSACVFNNVADRALDARMARTAARAVAAGKISPFAANMFGSALLLAGVVLLLRVNFLALGAALGGFVVYVFMYTPLKPRSAGALFVGAVAGAMPPAVGYAAAAQTLDLWALGLFAFMYLWQLPHFWAIARYRFDDYKNAGVPLLAREPKSEQEKTRARRIFFGSLIVLVLFCAVLVW